MDKKSPVSDKEIELSRIHVFSIAEGFLHSSVLFAMLKLNIFELIGEGNKSLKELADKLNVKPDTLARLLNAGVNLKLLSRKDDMIYELSKESRNILLPSSGENYIGDFILNMDYFRLGLAKLDEAVSKSCPTIEPASFLGSDKDHTRKFAHAMHNSASIRSKEFANFLDTTNCKTLLDVGCGSGTFSFHLALKNPALEIYLADMPKILEVTKEIQGRFPLKNRVHYIPMDALKDDIPGAYDIVIISNTLHMLGEEGSRQLIKKLYKSINRKGSLVIQAQFMDNDKLGSRWSIYMDLIQLCVTSDGRNHSVGETREWLEDAGFINIEYNQMSFINNHSFLRGYKAQ